MVNTEMKKTDNLGGGGGGGWIFIRMHVTIHRKQPILKEINTVEHEYMNTE